MVIKEALIVTATIALGVGGAAAINSFGSEGDATADSGTAIIETAVSVERVIDGDTVVTSAGTVRLLGIDAPDKGACGFDEATLALSSMLQPGKMVGLVATDKDIDQYNRLLRYIKVDEMDTGYQLIRNEVADARYDSRDRYSSRPREEECRAADTAPNSACVEPPPPPPPGPVSPDDPPPPPATAVPAPTPRKFEVVPSPNFFTPEYFPPEYFPPTTQPVRTPPGTVIIPNPIPPTSPPPGTPIPSPEPTPTPEPTGTVTPSPEPTETTTPSPEPTETATPTPDPSETTTPSPDPEPTATFTFTPEPEPTATFIADPWNYPGPDLNCSDIGHPVTITGIDYHNLDGDGDGIGCQAF